jgi:hypothetical protein
MQPIRSQTRERCEGKLMHTGRRDMRRCQWNTQRSLVHVVTLRGLWCRPLAHVPHRPTSALVLILPDVTKKFDIYCGTSHRGLGYVLMQEGHVYHTHADNWGRTNRTIQTMILSSPQWYMLLRYGDTISSDTNAKYTVTTIVSSICSTRWIWTCDSADG